MQIVSLYFLELPIHTIHCFLAVYLELQQNVNTRTAPITKVKVKNCAHSSERLSCLCIVGMETSFGIRVLTQPKYISEGITVRGPHTGGRMRPGGRLLRTTGLKRTNTTQHHHQNITGYSRQRTMNSVSEMNVLKCCSLFCRLRLRGPRGQAAKSTGPSTWKS